MSKLTGRLWLVLLLMGAAALVMGITGCPGPPEPTEIGTPPEEIDEPAPTPEGEPLKIGAIFALTGAASSLGEPERDTAKMLEEQINAEGGIDGRPLEIIVRDTKGEETEALTAVTELIETENVLAIVGPSRSGTTMGVVEAVKDAEVPLISCAAASVITDPVREWVFVTPQNDHDAVARIYQYLNSQDITRIAALTASTGFGEPGRQQLMDQAPDAGIEVVADEQFADSDTDMTAQLTKIKATDAQAIVCWGIGPAPAQIAKNVQQLGIEIPLIMSHGVANRRFIEGAGDAAEGIILPAGKLLVASQLPDDDPAKELLLEYSQQFEEKYGRSADTFGGHAWDAVMLVVSALRDGATDRAAIRDHVEATQDFQGIGGTFNFSADSHYGLSPDAFVMVEIVDGDWQLITDE